MNPKDFERVKLEPITLTKDNTHPVKFLSLKKLSEDFENIDSKIKELVLRVIAESNPSDEPQPARLDSDGLTKRHE